MSGVQDWSCTPRNGEVVMVIIWALGGDGKLVLWFNRE